MGMEGGMMERVN